MTLDFNYADLAPVYDQETERCVPGYVHLVSTAVRTLVVPDGGIALDLCCGTGRCGEEIMKQFRPGQLHCVDGAREMLTVCEERLRGNANVCFLHTDIFAYRPSVQFDAVMCGLLLHIFCDEQKREILRMLRMNMSPGARLAIMDVIRYDDPKVHQEQLDARVQFALRRGASQNILRAGLRKEAEKDHPSTATEMETLLCGAGFTDVQTISSEMTIGLFTATVQ